MTQNLDEKFAERRKFVRLNVGCEVNYKVLNVEPPKFIKSKTKNISAGGICLIADEKLNPGTLLELNFHLPDKAITIRAKGRVAWVNPFKIANEKERFDCGIEFVEISPKDQKIINQYVFSFK